MSRPPLPHWNVGTGEANGRRRGLCGERAAPHTRPSHAGAALSCFTTATQGSECEAVIGGPCRRGPDPGPTLLPCVFADAPSHGTHAPGPTRDTW